MLFVIIFDKINKTLSTYLYGCQLWLKRRIYFE